MAADPDYDAAIMQLAHDTLSKDTKIDYEIVARLQQVMAKVSSMTKVRHTVSSESAF